MSVPQGKPAASVTEHGLLVPLGRFVQEIGLREALERVPIPMKTVEHSPTDKALELLAHIVAGGMHVNELAVSPHPLLADSVVARAWGQERFASASGINALLRTVTGASVTALQTQVRQVTAPYRQRILRSVSVGWLVVDLDLTGLVVGDQALTYEGAEFGFMGGIGQTGRGYQFARAQLAAPHEALMLGGFLHGGRTVSLQCLAELVTLVEAELGRPRRRGEAVATRLAQAEGELNAAEAKLARRRGGPRPPERKPSTYEIHRDRLRALVGQLRARLAALEAENATIPNPRRIILRLDGGFGHGEQIAWLYEQGYEVVVRAQSFRVAARLQTEVGLSWEKISKNGFIAASRQTTVTGCPYPLRLFACKQWWGPSHPEEWSALIVTPGLSAADWSARRVGLFANGRQIIEAGIKEAKGIFASRHLPTRHRAGIAFYQELVLLAQNLIRWFRRQVLGGTLLAAAGVKELVSIGTRSRAIIGGRGTRLTFAEDSPWRGISLSLANHLSYQLFLPLLDSSL